LRTRRFMQLEDMLVEWVRFVRRGNGWGKKYPPAWPLKDVWIPYRVGATEDEKLDELARQTPADEKVAKRVEDWMLQLECGPRRANLVVHAYLPDDTKDIHGNSIDWERLTNMRRGLYLKRWGFEPTRDVFVRWFGDGMGDLRLMYGKWRMGV
jgi:hypothetical protein